MYNTTIGRMLSGKIDERRIAGHYLYIVREDEIVFYVGQSIQPLLRFKAHLGMSAIGDLIINNQPVSYEWAYDLLRPAECSAYIEILTGRQDIPRRELGKHPAFFESDLSLVEDDLIDFLRPCLNVQSNRHPTPLPERYAPGSHMANAGVKLD